MAEKGRERGVTEGMGVSGEVQGGLVGLGVVVMVVVDTE